MKQKLSPFEAAIKLYSYDRDEYVQFCELPENKDKSSLFYRYVQIKLSEYCDVISSIDGKQLEKMMAQTYLTFRDDMTLIKFIPLVKNIEVSLLEIVKELYKPNQTKAFVLLETLLGENNRRLKYLVEPYVNYLKFHIDNKHQKTLFRVLYSDKELDNCWHTPFNIRENAYTGRFGIQGHPCLYLGEEKETCFKEVAEDDKKQHCYVGEFIPKCPILCIDLRLNSELIEENLENEELINFLLTYPIRLLCSITTRHKSQSFCEEYLFSQAFMSLMMHPMDDEKLYMARYHGIIYDSTKNKGGVNYALYAKSEEYPPRADEVFSNRLISLFEHSCSEFAERN